MLRSKISSPDDDTNNGKEDGNGCDGEDKESHFSLERGKSSFGVVGHGSNAAEHGIVTSGNNDTNR